MAKTLILTPNHNLCCGMYQLAKDLAEELDGVVMTKENSLLLDGFSGNAFKDCEVVITFLYPMHKYGKKAKKMGLRWVCYDQGVPPVTKQYFPKFFRRQYMKWFSWVNERSKKGADEYWNVTKREQKPRWTERISLRIDKNEVILTYHGVDLTRPYAIYIGRTTDYKNVDWLKKTMEELGIPLLHPESESDKVVHAFLSNAKLLVTASTWEGYGRPVMEAAALKVPFVCFDTGAHKRQLLKSGGTGFVVPNHNFEMFEDKLREAWEMQKDEV